jgi:hypothetical protein
LDAVTADRVRIVKKNHLEGEGPQAGPLALGHFFDEDLLGGSGGLCVGMEKGFRLFEIWFYDLADFSII